MTYFTKGAFTAAAALFLALPAYAASIVQVDLSGSTNISLQNGGYIAGSSYPRAGASIGINRVSFKLSSFGGGLDAGTVQTGFGRPDSITIPITNIANVSRIYTLANTAGTGSPVPGDFTFNFAGGSSYRYDLTQGANIRDHLGSTGEAQPALAFGTATFGTDAANTVYLDVQRIDLPSLYRGRTLTSLTINDLGGAANPFIAAVSVEQSAVAGVPEPATWAMMIGGFGLTGGVLRHRRTVRIAYA